MATTHFLNPEIRKRVWERRAAGEKQHQLAAACDIDPATFSSIINDHLPLKPDDPRVQRIAALLGIDPPFVERHK
jgi:hypothetical protein